ncbi:MAG: hypothetical protein ACOCVI_03670 [Planctomycetota bacterium]
MTAALEIAGEEVSKAPRSDQRIGIADTIRFYLDRVDPYLGYALKAYDGGDWDVGDCVLRVAFEYGLRVAWVLAEPNEIRERVLMWHADCVRQHTNRCKAWAAKWDDQPDKKERCEKQIQENKSFLKAQEENGIPTRLPSNKEIAKSIPLHMERGVDCYPTFKILCECSHGEYGFHRCLTPKEDGFELGAYSPESTARDIIFVETALLGLTSVYQYLGIPSDPLRELEHALRGEDTGHASDKPR